MNSTKSLHEILQINSNPKTKLWWETYLKGVIPFRGMKMSLIRNSLHFWYNKERIAERFSLKQQKEIAFQLIEEKHTEDKLAGILFLQEILLPQKAIKYKPDLNRISKLFTQGFIDDWNTCDWFCVKFLGPLIKQEGKECAEKIASWKNSSNLWLRRASIVAFVNLAKKGDENFSGFTNLLLDICYATIKHPERFSQTGTGWVLRELSLTSPEKVVSFVQNNISYFSAEGLRYAAEKIANEDKLSLKSLHKEKSVK